MASPGAGRPPARRLTTQPDTQVPQLPGGKCPRRSPSVGLASHGALPGGSPRCLPTGQLGSGSGSDWQTQTLGSLPLPQKDKCTCRQPPEVGRLCQAETHRPRGRHALGRSAGRALPPPGPGAALPPCPMPAAHCSPGATGLAQAGPQAWSPGPPSLQLRRLPSALCTIIGNRSRELRPHLKQEAGPAHRPESRPLGRA